MAAVEMAFFLCLSISSNMRLLFLLKFLSEEESSSSEEDDGDEKGLTLSSLGVVPVAVGAGVCALFVAFQLCFCRKVLKAARVQADGGAECGEEDERGGGHAAAPRWRLAARVAARPARNAARPRTTDPVT